MKTLTAQLLRSPQGHEVVHGPTGSGKTTLVKQLIADDEANGREILVIDPLGVSLPEWRDRAHRYAHDMCGADEILTDLVHAVQYDAWSRRPLVVTLDPATRVLEDLSCRRLVEEAVTEARGRDIRLRMVVNSLLLPGFGYSETIRAAVLDDAEAVA